MIQNLIRLVLILTVPAFWGDGALAARLENKPSGLRVYTAMNYIKLEGERYGLQIVIVPYAGGEKILWRSGVGKLSQPLLLEAKRTKNIIHVVVPDTDDNSGAWTLLLQGDLVHAVGPRNLSFDLRETAFK